MAKEIVESEDLRRIADIVIRENGLEVNLAKVGYCLVAPNISKRVAGRCIRTVAELKHFSEYDFLIEMSSDLWSKLDDDRKKILMLHELLHIDISTHPKSGDLIFKIKDHDIQDFRYVVKKYGPDWISDLNTINSSLYDIDPDNDPGYINL